MRQKLMLLVSILVLSSWNTFSQSLNHFSYTLQIRVDGNVLANEVNKNVVVTIYKADKVTAVFSETISNISTNNVGICKLKIGSGVPILTGTLVEFSKIDWIYLGYTVGFNWDGKNVRLGNKSLFKIAPYAISANLAMYVDTLRSKNSDTIIVIEDMNISHKSIINLNTLGFNNSETIDNSTIGQIKITADSTYISGMLKIDSLKSSTTADIFITKGIDLLNNNISGVKALNINPTTNSISGITTIGEVVLTTAGFASPLYLATDGLYKLSDNTLFDKSRCVALSTNSEVANTQPLLLHGYIKKDSWNFNKGDLIYINGNEISNVKPTTTEHFVQQIGYAVDVNIIYFDPQEVKKITSMVTVSPSIQQIVKVNEKSDPLTVAEFPSALSRKWYYGTMANGPFDQYLSANDNEMTIHVNFGSTNTYFVVCKSTYSGNVIVTSNPVKVFCGQNSVIPIDNQTLKLNTLSLNQLTISTNPVATAYQWVYDENENGTFSSEILDSTSTTFTPIFKNNGNYFVKCRATINNVYIYSNAIKVFVSGVSLTPSVEQLVKAGADIQQITVDDGSATSRLWLYSPNIDGPFSTSVNGTLGNPQSITTNGLPEGVYYVICVADGTPSNPVKITIVQNSISPTLQFTSQMPNILTLDFGATTPDSWVWYSGSTKNNITIPMQSLITQTPLSMNSNDSVFYSVKTTYGTNVITSNISSVYSGLEIISPKTMVFKQTNSDTLRVGYRVVPDIVKWYRVGTTVALTNTLTDKSKYLPSDNTVLVVGQKHQVYCLGNYGGIMVSSDTVDIVVADFAIANNSEQVIPEINKSGTALSIVIAPNPTSVKWNVIENSVASAINGATANSYTPKFGNAGAYKVYCDVVYPEGVISSDTIEIVVFDLRLVPNQKQVLYGDVELSTEIGLIVPLVAGATKEWYFNDVIQTSEEKFSPKTFPANTVVNNLYSKINYKGIFYQSNTIKILSGKVNITNPTKRHVFIHKDATQTFVSSAVLDNTDLTYSVKNNNNIVTELGSINLYKFLDYGNYVFYAKNKTYNISPWKKTFKDSVEVTVTDILLNSYTEQFIQLGTNISSLTATAASSLLSPSYQWKYGATESSINQLISGGATPTLNSFLPGQGSYYLRCDVTSQGVVLSSPTVKINIIDNKISPVAQQTIEAFTDGSNLTTSTTLTPDSLRWFKTENSNSTSIANATGLTYLPNLNAKTWTVSCKYYYHNSSGVVSLTTNSVQVKSISAQITESATQYLADLANSATLNLVESHPAVSRQWYYKRSDGTTMDAEEILVGKTILSMQTKFAKGYHYYVYCRSTYNFSGGSLDVESNIVDLVVPKVTLTPEADQPDVRINASGIDIALVIAPSDIATTTVKWYGSPDATTMDGTTILNSLNKQSILPALPNIHGALAYMVTATFGNSFNLNAENYVCIGSSRTITTPYLKDEALVYGDGFFPRAGVPNNPKICGTPTTPAGVYWVDPDGYGGKKPVKAYCDGTWTSLGETEGVAFTNCGASGRYGPIQDSLTLFYSNNGLMSGEYAVTTNGNNNTIVGCGIQNWVAPVAATYYMEALGSRGSGKLLPNKGRGKGARYIGIFDLVKGKTLRIIVGQYAENVPVTAGGGGGGSFIWRINGLSLCIIAGGGGGASSWDDTYGSNPIEIHGQITRGGGYRNLPTNDGYGGKVLINTDWNGGGGAGWSGDGVNASGSNSGQGGKGIRDWGGFGGYSNNGGNYGGDNYGGFGGGGGNGYTVGGGGGGFTGGQGGYFNKPAVKTYSACGGGSYNSGMTTNGYTQIKERGVNDAMGKVIIKYKLK